VYLKTGLIRGVVSLEGYNLVVFYYLSVSENWPDKRVVFGERGFIRGGTTGLIFWFLQVSNTY
jgi:hypothetical protein